ncbi:MAG: glycosyltransferase family 4 protein [Chloroflexi bacterium]|nr:glycosyltransferase family 4 protein [Chloroflexota bacterium]
MKILHTVQFYSPSVGGAQEVVKQISERLVQRGHTVTVATSRQLDRSVRDINGVHIEEFEIRGNSAQGIQGETERYQSFLRHGSFDLMINYAAQQWATDLVYPILDELPYKKILIPCGFSGLYLPEFAGYFRELPYTLRNYDHLVFHADDYRDTNFARQYGLQRWSIIPNGASLAEFEAADTTFRERYHIPADEHLLLTVGSHTGVKGHALVLEAFRRLKAEHATLVIIGNVFGKGHWWRNFVHPLLSSTKQWNFARAAEIVSDAILGGIGPTGCLSSCQAHARRINLQNSRKKVLLLDLPRMDVVAAYRAADLFLFGSNIEYSPIVLYETMASRTPFVSLACGNATEIAAWSSGGIIAPTIQKEQGFVDGDSVEFAGLVDELLTDLSRRQSLAEAGYKAWLERFTWEKIAADYEALYQSLLTS